MKIRITIESIAEDGTVQEKRGAAFPIVNFSEAADPDFRYNIKEIVDNTLREMGHEVVTMPSATD